MRSIDHRRLLDEPAPDVRATRAFALEDDVAIVFPVQSPARRGWFVRLRVRLLTIAFDLSWSTALWIGRMKRAMPGYVDSRFTDLPPVRERSQEVRDRNMARVMQWRELLLSMATTDAAREEIEAIADEAGIPRPTERDSGNAMAILRRYDRHCPHAQGYILAKAYEGSMLADWYDGDPSTPMFLGLIETLPGRPVVYHELCLICSSHFEPTGSTPDWPMRKIVH
jgi:hypothetical protein